MDPQKVERRVQKAKELMSANWKAPITLSQRQRAGTKYFPDKSDKIWVCRTSLPVPEDVVELRARFLQTVNGLSTRTHSVVTPAAIHGEWVAERRPEQPAPSSVASEEQQLKHLNTAAPGSTAILYLHGGGFILGSPSLSRQAFSAPIAKRTHSRCFSLEYRLSPQHMFPDALFDTLLAYLAILHQPVSETHRPISDVVLAGDSAGANLCFAFVQLLLHLRKKSTSILYAGREVEVPLPAGVCGISGYFDLTDCMPSIQTATFDYFQKPKLENAPDHPRDDIWPTVPQRESVYCHDDQLCNMLCNPMLASSWRGAPPMWLAAGDEIVSDSCKAIATRAASQGVAVWWRQYQGVPHVWHLLPGLGDIPQTVHCLDDLARFVESCTSSPRSISSSGHVFQSPSFAVKTIDIHSSLGLSFDQVKKRAEARAAHLRELHSRANSKI